MDLPDELAVVHQPVRLRLMALLYKSGDVAATAARAALGGTPGNLDAHARRLQAAGLLTVRNALTPNGFESRYEPTRDGVARFEAYLAWLESFLSAAR